MEQKLLSIVLLAILCAGPGHALRLLNDVDGGRGFSFGSKTAAAAGGAETEPLDPTLSDDYENEISHVEFEPELGSAAPYAAAAAAPVPAAATTATITVAAAAPEAVKARSAAAAEAAGTRSMKWWLPPSTMPSFPLFPTPGGMPGIPGLPMPGMPFHPIGGWGVPAPPDQAPPAPPAAAANTNANDPNANGGVN